MTGSAAMVGRYFPTDQRRPGERPLKDDADCCLSTMDDHGRMTPGFCGPDCVRRPMQEEPRRHV